jgi:hypothetical protein
VTSNPHRTFAVSNDMVGGNLVPKFIRPGFPLPILMMLAAVRSTLNFCNTTRSAIAVLGMMCHKMS